MSDDQKPDPDQGDGNGKPDAPDLGDAGKKAIKAERDARAAEKKRADDAEARLAAIEDKDKTEVERLTAQVTELTRERDTATVSSARLRVALDKGLTPTQAKRLVGATEEELSADADELISDLGVKPSDERKPPPAGQPRVDLKPGNGDPDVPVEETDTKKLGARMFQH